ncbi:SAUR-like auxin-responsive protein family [Rhynchospora pubera]|uniref:SAUR-like auxin-responsive protein family n=1 Tax=Rhynchospora pubera TaxID=906938 RepID=A0AAV8D2X3_9POAL|nr:SAUR-like auxin-responsive protein family [Rhynchospora pubera]
MGTKNDDKKTTETSNRTQDDPVKPTAISTIWKFFRKWQNTTAKNKQSISRSISQKTLSHEKNICFDEEDTENSPSEDECVVKRPFIYPDIPRGHFGILVGLPDQEPMRFVMPLKFLRLPPFQVMLMKSRLIYGYVTDGPIRFPVEPDTFRYILQCSLAQYNDEPFPYYDYDPSSD